MRVLYFKPDGTSNFGDALNDYLWSRLLPKDAGKGHNDILFLGVGTLLTLPVHPADRYVVFGAGVGYGPPPALDGRWHVYFVRGPKSAEALGLPDTYGLTDPSILVRGFVSRSDHPSFDLSFMPRWDTVQMDATLALRCANAGVHMIDPRWPVEEVMCHICDSARMLSEAMHGAIVADAVGVPWLPVRISREHDFKWNDWCESVSLKYDPVDMDIHGLLGAAQMRKWKLSAESERLSLFDAVTEQLSRLTHDMVSSSGPFSGS